MLNKLKNKFVLINTLMVGAVLLLIVGAIFVITLFQGVRSDTRALEDILDNREPEKDIAYATIQISDTGAYVLQNELQISNEALINAAKYLSNVNSNYSFSIRHGVIYESKENEQGTVFAFSSLVVVLSEAESAFINASNVVAVALFLLFLLSRKLAKAVIKPTKDAWENQKRFVADASHDLKTPLTVIMANNEILMSHPEKTVGEQMKWIESTRDEGEYMRALINKMLELAKSDSKIEKIELTDTNISEITEKAVLQFEPVAFESEVEIASRIEPQITIESSSEDYYRLVQILIDNAVKYSPRGSVVFVSLTASKKEIVFSVNNKGDVIPSEQLEHIFDRFYRADDARTKGSFGLGLSIAKNIAQALQGEICASSTEADGTTFTVKFKL